MKRDSDKPRFVADYRIDPFGSSGNQFGDIGRAVELLEKGLLSRDEFDAIKWNIFQIRERGADSTRSASSYAAAPPADGLADAYGKIYDLARKNVDLAKRNEELTEELAELKLNSLLPDKDGK